MISNAVCCRMEIFHVSDSYVMISLVEARMFLKKNAVQCVKVILVLATVHRIHVHR